MDFRELTYVLAIAQHQSITKAAESLYVSQPTLSKFLKSLESELGLRIFRKLGNKYTLTYAGERYVEKARQILQIKSSLERELADISKNNVGVLKVAFPTMRCSYMLPYTLPAFRHLYPNVKVHTYDGQSDELDRKLLSGEADIVFYTEPRTPNPDLEYDTLGEDELLICTCKDHPIGRFATPNPASRYPHLDLTLLQDELIIMMLPSQRTGQIFEAISLEEDLHFNNIIYTGNIIAIMELAAAGYGVSFVFETHLRHRTSDRKIDCYSFGTPRTASKFVAAYRKGSYLSVYAQDFIELVRQLYWKYEGV